MQTILLTGGAGYIGSHTLLELAKTKQYKLVVFDNLKNGHKEAVDLVREHTGAEIELIQGELLNPGEIDTVFAEREVFGVIHFAALIEAGVSVVHPTKFYENNVVGTLNLLKAMQAHSVKKLVFSSTAAVYGTPKDTKVTEETELNPESAYGDSKYEVERILNSLVQPDVDPAEKIDSVVLRYFNAAGANPELLIGQDYPKPTHLITVAVQAALGLRDKLTIFGKDYPTPDGTCIRDYIHVEDLARAHVAALDYLQHFTGREIINVGTGVGSSNLDVIKELEKIHGEFAYEFGPRRPGDPVGYYADNSKARTILSWQPKYGLSEIVQHSYNWQKTYPTGYAGKAS